MKVVLPVPGVPTSSARRDVLRRDAPTLPFRRFGRAPLPLMTVAKMLSELFKADSNAPHPVSGSAVALGARARHPLFRCSHPPGVQLAVEAVAESSHDSNQSCEYSLAHHYFWGSVGRSDADGAEYIVYRLAEPVCLVTGIYLEPAQLRRCYGPRQVSLTVGMTLDDVLPAADDTRFFDTRDEIEAATHGATSSGKRGEDDDDDDEVEINAPAVADPAELDTTPPRVRSTFAAATSPPIDCAPRMEFQALQLNEPLVGGYVRVDFLGFLNKHFVTGYENLYYHCINHVVVAGFRATQLPRELAAGLLCNVLRPSPEWRATDSGSSSEEEDNHSVSGGDSSSDNEHDERMLALRHSSSGHDSLPSYRRALKRRVPATALLRAYFAKAARELATQSNDLLDAIARAARRRGDSIEATVSSSESGSRRSVFSGDSDNSSRSQRAAALLGEDDENCVPDDESTASTRRDYSDMTDDELYTTALRAVRQLVRGTQWLNGVLDSVDAPLNSSPDVVQRLERRRVRLDRALGVSRVTSGRGLAPNEPRNTSNDSASSGATAVEAAAVDSISVDSDDDGDKESKALTTLRGVVRTLLSRRAATSFDQLFFDWLDLLSVRFIDVQREADTGESGRQSMSASLAPVADGADALLALRTLRALHALRTDLNALRRSMRQARPFQTRSDDPNFDMLRALFQMVQGGTAGISLTDLVQHIAQDAVANASDDDDDGDDTFGDESEADENDDDTVEREDFDEEDEDDTVEREDFDEEDEEVSVDMEN